MDMKMNESLDLRNRILKMRESNNLIINNSNSTNNNLMSKFESSIKKGDSKNSKSQKQNVNSNVKETKSNTLKKNTENEIIHKRKLESQNPKNSLNDNEAQFLMLANKFNEAVEVILELSEKVEKLEKASSKNYHKNKDKNFFLKIFNLKLFTFLLITPVIILSFFTLPIDFVLIKSIILDIISNI